MVEIKDYISSSFIPETIIIKMLLLIEIYIDLESYNGLYSIHV